MKTEKGIREVILVHTIRWAYFYDFMFALLICIWVVRWSDVKSDHSVCMTSDGQTARDH
jgi:hypothetical protein